MGTFYTNITLQGPERARVIQALEKLHGAAYVGPAVGDMVVVFDEQADEEPDLLPEIARELTRELGCVGLAALVHDDDVFACWLVRRGEIVDEYVSHPGYFEGGNDPPSGGNAELLANTFGAGNAAAVERILRAPAKQSPYRFESARHAALAEVLGLPDHAVGLGYDYIYQGEAGEIEEQLTHVGGDDDDDEDGDDAGADAAMQAQLAAFGGGGLQAQLDEMNAAARTPAHGYFPALLAGDAAAIRALFAAEPLLDDPVTGRVDGAGLDAHVAAVRALFANGAASYTPTGTVETAERVVSHGQIMGHVGGEMVMLPCACVWERAGEGKFRELRAYWSPAGLKGQRGERAVIVQPNAGLTLPGPIGAHLQALAADDVAGVLATYDPGCVSPMPWADPEDTVRRQYGAQVGEQGAIVITPSVVTQGGDACAVEFVTTRWDGADVPAQPGLAIYELRGGRICNVRVFGDLAPAPLGGLGAMGGLGDLFGGGMGGGMPGAGMGGFGIEGLSGLGGPGGMPGMGGVNFDDVPPEVMQQAMDEAMRMLSSGNLGDIMKNLQQMMGGMGGMPGMPGIPGGGIDFGALGGFPGMGAMPDGWDDDDDDAAGDADGAAPADDAHDDAGDAEPPAGGGEPK